MLSGRVYHCSVPNLECTSGRGSDPRTGLFILGVGAPWFQRLFSGNGAFFYLMLVNPKLWVHVYQPAIANLNGLHSWLLVVAQLGAQQRTKKVARVSANAMKLCA